MTSLLRPMLICGSARAARNYVLTTAVRTSRKTCAGGVSPKMMQLQKKFQEKNNKPVFLKGGTLDNILYRTTMALCILGLAGNVHLFLGYILA